MVMFYKDFYGNYMLINATLLKKSLVEYSRLNFPDERPDEKSFPLFNEENLMIFLEKLDIKPRIVTFVDIKDAFLGLLKDLGDSTIDFNVLFVMEKTYFLSLAFLMLSHNLSGIELKKIIAMPFHTRTTYLVKKISELENLTEDESLDKQIFIQFKNLCTPSSKTSFPVFNLDNLPTSFSSVINIHREQLDSIKNIFGDAVATKAQAAYASDSREIFGYEGYLALFTLSPGYYRLRNFIKTALELTELIPLSQWKGHNPEFDYKNLLLNPDYKKKEASLTRVVNTLLNSLRTSYYYDWISHSPTITLDSRELTAYNLNLLFPLLATSYLNNKHSSAPPIAEFNLYQKSINFSLEKGSPTYITFFEFLYGIFKSSDPNNIFSFLTKNTKNPFEILRTTVNVELPNEPALNYSDIDHFNYLTEDFPDVKNFLNNLFPNLEYATEDSEIRKRNFFYLHNYFCKTFSITGEVLSSPIVTANKKTEMINQLLKTEGYEVSFASQELKALSSYSVIEKISNAMRAAIDENNDYKNFNIAGDVNITWTDVYNYLDNMRTELGKLRTNLTFDNISDTIGKYLILDIMENYIDFLQDPDKKVFSNFSLKPETVRLFKIIKVLNFLFQKIGEYNDVKNRFVEKFYSYIFILLRPGERTTSEIKSLLIDLGSFQN